MSACLDVIVGRRYEENLRDFYENTEKVLSSGGTRQINLDCSVGLEQGRFLYDLVRELKPARTLEVGMAWGGSSVHILSALAINGEGTHTAVDPFQNSIYSGIGVSEMQRLGLSHLCEAVERKSDLVLPEMVAKGERFGFVFIDGDHRFDGVFVDFHYSQQLLETGGALVFDDAFSAPQQHLISFIRSNFPNMEYRGIHEGRFAYFAKTGVDERGDESHPF